ncbi:POK9 protein, partial [Pandion haliaetus]|nr:POK9 protein [Pandion haliaetus]
RGSLGLDLATAVDVTLTNKQPQKVSTTVKGPLIINGRPHGALLLGRSSSGLRGLFILLGLIDSDYQGQISIVVQTCFPPIYIPKGSRIAQLVPIPHLLQDLEPRLTRARGSSGFGSTGGLALLTLPLHRRPFMSVTLRHGSDTQQLNALLGTGADITIVA